MCLPESPRYLLLKGRESEARVSLGRLMTRSADSPEVERERIEIMTALQTEQKTGSATYIDCFRNNENKNGFRTWTGIMLQGVCLFFFSFFFVISLTIVVSVATIDGYQFHLCVYKTFSCLYITDFFFFLNISLLRNSKFLIVHKSRVTDII
jgi:MFS transporter, SP family, sugar:H+ symporter